MTAETFLNGRVTLHAGDSRDVLKTIPDCSIDSIVTDPPYALVSIVKRFGKAGSAVVKVPEDGSGAYARASAGFMGKAWDTGETAFDPSFWSEVLRVLKPGGHLVAFSGTRTYHRMVCAIEDSGFEVRDQIGWAYGSGFPKSHDVSKGIDKAAGVEREVVGEDPQAARRNKTTSKFSGVYGEIDDAVSCPLTAPATESAQQWEGWGTALKPAWEPICLARKPLSEKTVAANVLKWGTGAINVDGCRVGTEGGTAGSNYAKTGQFGIGGKDDIVSIDAGRWPANIIHDGSEEVIAAFPDVHGAGSARSGKFGGEYDATSYDMGGAREMGRFGDEGSAARFFYQAKADSDDRLGSKHPTVKPVDLMQWLCRLVTPKGGTILDPFAGTGTTGEAAFREGFNAILIEREEEYQADIRRRMGLVLSGPDERSRESIKARTAGQPIDHGPLFGGLDTPPAGQENLRGLRGRTIGPIGMRR